MSEQKVVSKRIALGLGLLVIVLLAALIVVTTGYLQTNSNSSSTDNKDNQIAYLKAQIIDLNSILNLEKTEDVVKDYAVNQGANNFTQVVHRSFSYSGYLVVSGTSTTSNAWVKLDYWFDGKLYSFTQTLGTSGELFFAIPKTDSAAIYSGNQNLEDGATETLTIVYHY